MEKKVNVFKEWTSKRPWKERKHAAKAREASPLQISEPELIFYGQHSGVIGCTRDELYRTVNDDELLMCGYDKVIVSSSPSPICGCSGLSFFKCSGKALRFCGRFANSSVPILFLV